MFEKIAIAVTSKLAVVILCWLAVASVGALTTSVALGKAAFEDSSQVNKELVAEVKAFSESMSEFKILVSGVRRSDFRGQLKDLYKQAYKMDNDPGDIKPIDIVSAVNFCGGELFESYSDGLSGSEMVTASDYCDRAESWIKNN